MINAMTTVTLYHNPHCSKSRAVLARIRAAGIEPHIVEYLNGGLDGNTLAQLLRQSGVNAQDAMRQDHEAYAQYVAQQNLSEAECIALMVRYPALLNRPFVQSDKGAALCRPPELVDNLL